MLWKHLTLKQASGMAAEEKAKAFLIQAGLFCVEQNFRCPQGEIDLIMKEGETFVFVEVRYRKQQEYGSPLATVTLSKQNKIVKTAALFMLQKGLLQKHAMRFDVIGFTGPLAEAEPLWIKQAFLPINRY